MPNYLCLARWCWGCSGTLSSSTFIHETWTVILWVTSPALGRFAYTRLKYLSWFTGKLHMAACCRLCVCVCERVCVCAFVCVCATFCTSQNFPLSVLCNVVVGNFRRPGDIKPISEQYGAVIDGFWGPVSPPK